MSDRLMTLMFTDHQCKEVVKQIDASGTRDPDLLRLADAMRPNALKIKRGAFMSYVRASDDEILAGFRLSDHSIEVSVEAMPDRAGHAVSVAVCPKCGGRNGSHNTLHTRWGNGWGGNSPCPLAPDRAGNGGTDDNR